MKEMKLEQTWFAPEEAAARWGKACVDYISNSLERKVVQAVLQKCKGDGAIVRVLPLKHKNLQGICCVEYRQEVTVQEIVRCENCTYYEPEDEWGVCRNTGAGMQRNGFCSDGEREDDG